MPDERLPAPAAVTYGASISVIAISAILKYAVTASLAGIDINTVGLILMIAGATGLVIALFRTPPRSNRGV
jgi:hypothetical protein